MQSLSVEKRAALSRVILDARHSRGWSIERLAEEAEVSLRVLADSEAGASAAERKLWLSTEISRHHIDTLENCPARPLNTPDRRARLLGVVAALSLDRQLVNRLAGGI